jgi:hypothetical protein
LRGSSDSSFFGIRPELNILTVNGRDMAVIEADGQPIHFDFYTDNPKAHFEKVTEKVFNELRDDVSYRDYVAMAGDRSVSAVELPPISVPG